MKQVHLSLDSVLRDIFAFEEAKAVFDKYLPGMGLHRPCHDRLGYQL